MYFNFKKSGGQNFINSVNCQKDLTFFTHGSIPKNTFQLSCLLILVN